MCVADHTRPPALLPKPGGVVHFPSLSPAQQEMQVRRMLEGKAALDREPLRLWEQIRWCNTQEEARTKAMQLKKPSTLCIMCRARVCGCGCVYACVCACTRACVWVTVCVAQCPTSVFVELVVGRLGKAESEVC